VTWLKCLFFGHHWEARRPPPDVPGCERAYWDDYHVCLRCGADSRPSWVIQDDNEVRLERLYVLERARKL
jgi:hypothetical protein